MLWHKIWIYLLNANGNWVIHILPLSIWVACLTSASRYILVQGEIAFWLHVFDVSFNHGLEWYLKYWGPLASLHSIYAEDTYSSLVASSFCCKHFIQCLDVDLQNVCTHLHILISNLWLMCMAFYAFNLLTALTNALQYSYFICTYTWLRISHTLSTFYVQLNLGVAWRWLWGMVETIIKELSSSFKYHSFAT